MFIGGYEAQITNTTQKSTIPIKILVSTRKNMKDESIVDYDKYFDFIITERVGKIDNEDSVANKINDKKLSINVPNRDKSLLWWGRSLNTSETEHKDEGCLVERLVEKVKDANENKVFKDKLNKEFKGENLNLSKFEISGNLLLSLNFQINQLLMLINNPMLFPHLAYVRMFDKYVKRTKNQNN